MKGKKEEKYLLVVGVMVGVTEIFSESLDFQTTAYLYVRIRTLQSKNALIFKHFKNNKSPTRFEYSFFVKGLEPLRSGSTIGIRHS